MEIDPTLVAIVVALISSLGTYLVAAKRLSGRIKDSDASELWAESRSIREWSSARVVELDEHIDRLEARLVEVEKANSGLAEENRKVQREVFDLRSRIQHLQGENEALRNALMEERTVTNRLRWEAEHSPRRRHTDPPIPDAGESNGT
jgi:predicted nuclease with TOPRIM domain